MFFYLIILFSFLSHSNSLLACIRLYSSRSFDFEYHFNCRIRTVRPVAINLCVQVTNPIQILCPQSNGVCNAIRSNRQPYAYILSADLPRMEYRQTGYRTIKAIHIYFIELWAEIASMTVINPLLLLWSSELNAIHLKCMQFT